MNSVGIRELKQRASELLRRVREDGEEIAITYHGKVVARLVPVPTASQTEEKEKAWAQLDDLAIEIGARWPAGVTAAEAIAEGRR